MGGLRQEESGGQYHLPPNRAGASGAYQFLDSTWGNYGGYASAYLAPPDVQDARAKQLMTAYYQRFGNWSDVAKAWLGGPGSVHKVVSDGNITNVAYAANVLKLAGLSGGGSGLPPSAAVNTASVAPSADPAVQAQQAQAGPDRHSVDVQAQTILGLFSHAATPQISEQAPDGSQPTEPQVSLGDIQLAAASQPAPTQTLDQPLQSYKGAGQSRVM